jgi:hypothetical protein
MPHVVTVPELLDGHTVLDIECLDRIYLSGFVNSLQTPGGVIWFLHDHRGMPIASPAVFTQIGDRFRRAVSSYAEANHIPVVRFKATGRKIDVMKPYLERAAATGRSQVAAVGVAQEQQIVWTARQRATDPGKPPQFSFTKENRRVTTWYFYLWDEGFGPAFIKICAYFPYPVKVWVNGHEWAKRQAIRAGITFTELSNGFAATSDPDGLQAICDRLQPGTIEVFFQRWLARLPLPLSAADRAAGFWWELTMRQVEVSRTIVFAAPPPHPGVLRGPGRRQPRHRPARAHRDRLQAQPPRRQVPRRVQDRHRPARHRRHPEHLLQELPDQAVHERRPGAAHRDRHQRRLRLRLRPPAAQPHRATGQSP